VTEIERRVHEQREARLSHDGIGRRALEHDAARNSRSRAAPQRWPMSTGRRPCATRRIPWMARFGNSVARTR